MLFFVLGSFEELLQAKVFEVGKYFLRQLCLQSSTVDVKEYGEGSERVRRSDIPYVERTVSFRRKGIVLST